MRKSYLEVLDAIVAHWDTYGKQPERKWLQEYTGFSYTTVQHAIRHLDAANLIYAPKHSGYIGVIRKAKPKNPWDQEPVRF